MTKRTRFLHSRLLALLGVSLLCAAGCQGVVQEDPCKVCDPPAKRGIPLTAEQDPCLPGQPKKKLKPREGDQPFRVTSCQAQQDIRDLFNRVPGATPWQWNSIAGKLIGYGSAGVPQVAANLESNVERVPLMAAYVLGKIEDPRSLDALARAARGPNAGLRYEAATSMVRMGDRRGLPVLINGLDDRDPLVRARAIIVLYERTGETMDYKADDSPGERSAAVGRWRAWFQRTGGAVPR